jgi:transmembrane sensor
MSDDAERVSMEAADWLVRMRERPGDHELERAFAAWHDAAPGHGLAWGEMQALFEVIGDVKPRYPEHLSTGASSKPTVARPPRRRLWRKIPAMAAAVAALTVLVGPELSLRWQADHLTASGDMAKVTLDDGSHVNLGPESAIAVNYSRGRRDIRLLRGQAWFEVHPDPARPFRVTTDGIAATALGTAFDVRMIGAGRNVAVGHGRVRVEGAGVHVLGAGDWISEEPGHALRTGHQASDLAGIWRTGSVVIRGRTVAEAIDELRPWYKGRIILADDGIGQQKLTGIFRLTDPQEALRAMVQPHGGTILKLTPWVMIVTGK